MKYLYISLGFLSFGLGVVGTILPVLPTVPFLLLASLFFTKGSDKFSDWLHSTKLYNKYMKDFEESRSMTFIAKAKILTFASAMLLTAFFMTDSLHLKVFIGCLILFKYYYFVFKIKTIDGKEMQTSNDDK